MPHVWKRSSRSDVVPSVPTGSDIPDTMEQASARKHSQHPLPPATPCEVCRQPQHWRSLACPGYRQRVNKLNCFSAPPAPSFDANDDQTAPVTRQELTLLRLFVPCGRQHCAIGARQGAVVVALRTVISTASCARWWRGRPDTNTTWFSRRSQSQASR